jgi:hypothetical protein
MEKVFTQIKFLDTVLLELNIPVQKVDEMFKKLTQARKEKVIWKRNDGRLIINIMDINGEIVDNKNLPEKT